MVRIIVALFVALSFIGCANHKPVVQKYDMNDELKSSPIPLIERAIVSLMVLTGDDGPVPQSGYLFGREGVHFALHCEPVQTHRFYYICEVLSKRNVDRISITFVAAVSQCPEIRVGSLAWAYVNTAREQFVSPFSRTEVHAAASSGSTCTYILR